MKRNTWQIKMYFSDDDRHIVIWSETYNNYGKAKQHYGYLLAAGCCDDVYLVEHEITRDVTTTVLGDS